MNYNEQLKRIKLFMNYDSKKTLNENEEKIRPLLLEYKKGSKTLGEFCTKSDVNLTGPGDDPGVLKKGSCFMLDLRLGHIVVPTHLSLPTL